MDSMTPTLLGELPKILCLVVALVGGLLAASTWWRRHRSSAAFGGLQRNAREPINVGKIVYHDSPTVRVVDSQRVDRIRKVVQMTPGEFVDVLENRGSPVPRFRITLKN